MTSIDQDSSPLQNDQIKTPLTGEEIVITGLSGTFPNSEYVINFKENLFKNVDMVTDVGERWTINHPEIPKHLGKVRGLEEFDAQFFRVHYKQAKILEPMSKKILEHAYGAIYDSGINPVHLRGKKIGVFTGASFSDSEKNILFDQTNRNGFAVTGSVKSMHANRISYWMDAKGPSYSLDMQCASSLACLENAYRSINTGQCDAAIVGGSNLCLQPYLSLSLSRAGFLCLDGKTKCFDKNGDGYVRSDAISVVFLQKAKDARRIYCEVYFAAVSYALQADAKFLPIRSVDNIQNFLQDCYSKINVSPDDVEFIEANACGLAEADRNELQAIAKVFAKNKTIKVGSVKSNMGHGEAASGLCAVTKVCLAYQEGVIPANLHYNEPCDDISEIRNGKIQVVQDNTPFYRGFTAINTFSFGGTNVHVLLKGHYKPKETEKYKTNLPYLVMVSGRQEPGVLKILNNLEKQPVDPELISLLHEIHSSDISGHMCRGYTILMTDDNQETVSLSRSMEYCPGIVRPVCFVYSGMGSQWAGMGAELMRIPIFAAAIEKCNKVLSPRGVDILRILTEKDETIYDNILNSFVGIAAMQIGLTDVLTHMGITPDHIIGHSVGELGCAYADGCFTAEEMILSAYSRGLVSVESSFIKGSMAAIGLGYASIAPLCPSEIEVACHNSSESSTISGPAEAINSFVKELKKRGIFAKEVLCSNIAYHSRYIAHAGPNLLKYLQEVIKTPRIRSSKWMSTSMPTDQWDTEIAKFSSAEYHTNNLLNPVLFEETSKLIPSNALVIEIAPHGLLQAILKRSLSECVHIPLTRKNHENPVKYFLESIGKLYETGCNPKINVLYPKIQYPVSSRTPLLSHFVDWEHSESWPRCNYTAVNRIPTISRNFVMSSYDDDHKYLRGYIRNGKNVFPESALLLLVWETLAMSKGMDYRQLSVIFMNVRFTSEVIIKEGSSLKLCITISKGNKSFEISHCGSEIVSGVINESTNNGYDTKLPKEESITRNDDMTIAGKDIYRLLYYKGYSYREHFQTIHSTSENMNKSLIKWNNDWVSFIDGLFQFSALPRQCKGVSVPKLINNINICVQEHSLLNSLDENDLCLLSAEHCNSVGIIKCGGIQIKDVVFADMPEINTEDHKLESKVFVPYYGFGKFDIRSIIQINMQIVAKNVFTDNIKVVELLENDGSTLSDVIQKTTDSLPTKICQIDTFRVHKNCLETFLAENVDLIIKSSLLIINDFLSDEKKLKCFHETFSTEVFILCVEQSSFLPQDCDYFDVITAYNSGNQNFILIRKKNISVKATYITADYENKFNWLLQFIDLVKTSQHVVLVTEKRHFCGLSGTIEKLVKTYPKKVSLLAVEDNNAPLFDSENEIFKQQIQKRIISNTFKQGCWGGYFYLPISTSVSSKNIKLKCDRIREIDSINWVEENSTLTTVSTVKVAYAGLSKQDARTALGKVHSSKEGYGLDYSGLSNSNQKVMGLVSEGAISSIVHCDTNLLWPVPTHWSLEDAATVPLPYVLAYYCLAVRIKLRNIFSVFVSGGTGALGQAVISICLALECEVFTTVSNIHKKKHLQKLFPQLKGRNIFCCCGETFRNELAHLTNGALCDIVISNMTGKLRQEALRCVSIRGIFFDVSSQDDLENDSFGMHLLTAERSYSSIDLFNIFKPENIEERMIIQKMVTEGIAQGTVKPLSRVVYSPDDVGQAFRRVSNHRTIGRVLIKMDDVVRLTLCIQPRITCMSEGNYVILCDEGDLCIEIVDRLISRGARNIVFYTTCDFNKSYLYLKTTSWRKIGAIIEIIFKNKDSPKSFADIIIKADMLGSVYGIYFVHRSKPEQKKCEDIMEEISSNYNETVLSVVNLDLVSRNLCPKLRDFVLITNSSENIGDIFVASALENICQYRNKIGLPALYFKTQLIDEFDCVWNYNSGNKLYPQKINTVLNDLEASLRGGFSNVTTFSIRQKVIENNEFLNHISKILGYKNIHNIPDDMRLGDLTISDNSIEEIKMYIKHYHNVDYTKSRISEISFANLKSLHQNKNDTKTDFDSGLGAFYSFIEKDDCSGNDPVVAMSTTVSLNNAKEEELYNEKVYLMLIPGFEGHHKVFKTICERLKIHAMTFQLVPNPSEESIQQLAVGIYKIMKRRFELKSKFYLLGYSFGVNIALEVAALLEKAGCFGVIYCLDSSPDALRVHLDAYLGNLKEVDLQNIIVVHMYKLMSGKPSEDLKTELEKLNSWPEKVQACINKLQGLVHYSLEYQRSLIESAYKRIKLSKEYDPDLKLQSKLVLLKSIPHPDADKLPHDYSLSKYTTQPVSVFDLECDHVLAPQDLAVSNIINMFLDSTILEKFQKKNLCESYRRSENGLL